MRVDTGGARASGLVHIPDALERDLRSRNRARDREYKRALRDRLRVNGSFVRRGRRAA